ncbi:MAG: HigA family addiction module antitoxin [Thermoanaerobaculales bacterium]
MSRTATNEFEPDFVSLPGDTLQEVLDERGISQANLAERTGRPKKTINEIVQGKAAITPETALQLERVLGVPAAFWNNLERYYRENLARIEERERLLSHVDWLDRVPCRAMINKGWIKKCSDKVEQLREVLNFFGVASPNRWEEVIGVPAAAFRVSTAFEIDKGALTAWLRKGEIEAQRVHCRPFEKDEFRQVLIETRSLTVRPLNKVFSELQENCAKAGVAVVVVPELPRTRANGATQWLSKDKALIQLSLRYKREDVFWFTFFHEAGHIMLHGKRQVFVDSGKFTGDVEEEQANRFAADLLIPQESLNRFLAETSLSRTALVRFARSVGVHPGIVVGRLQHDKKIKHGQLNGLCRAIDPGTFAEAVRSQG